MHSCADVKAWKSVQVLAGSIIETLLIDYLSATKNTERPSKDPLKLDLAEAISICRKEKVLSDRTADLCSVIKSYRNLIHPGRMLRLGEQAPDQGSATIATALIEMITNELAETMRASVGLTAEQILSKIQRDANSLNILKHLLVEVSEHEKIRLLLELIPSAHQEVIEDDSIVEFDEFVKRKKHLELAYQVILDSVSDEARKRIASEYVRVLREEDGQTVQRYGKAFFKPRDMKFLSGSSKLMVSEHLLGNMPPVFNSESSFNVATGLAGYLDSSLISKWLDPFVRTLVSSLDDSIKTRCRATLIMETWLIGNENLQALLKRLDTYISIYKSNNDSVKSELIQSIRNEIEIDNTI
ncbi:MAG: hypothetical protein FD173_67 [Gallionellaceae bacterium]|nr:MAG: hypothetical protein FD173_67 [Gallionellaceae bacterium]